MRTTRNPEFHNTTLDPRSIIVLTREHIGDLVCTTPALRSLRRLYPAAHIAVEVGERAACVLEHNPHVDEIIVRPDHQGVSGKFRFILLLRRRKFDLAVMLATNSDMILHTWLGGIPRRAGIVLKKRFSGLLTHRIPNDPTAHEMVDNFRSLVGLLGGDISDTRPEIFPDDTDIAAVDRLLLECEIQPEETLIGLNPGASAPANRWLPERFAELGDRLAALPRTRVLLLGGPQDAEFAGQVCARMRSSPTALTGRLTVLQLGELLRRCSVVVTGDTGPMHLACAVGTPVVAVFGPAIPHESGPCYVPGNIVLRKVDACARCTKYSCRDDRRCMRAITADEVAAAVRRQLDARNYPPSERSPEEASAVAR